MVRRAAVLDFPSHCTRGDGLFVSSSIWRANFGGGGDGHVAEGGLFFIAAVGHFVLGAFTVDGVKVFV